MNEKNPNKNISGQDKERITSSGIDLSGESRAASFMQQDNSVLLSASMSDAVEIVSIADALNSIPLAREHFGKAFAMLNREYAKDTEGGYFIRVKKGRTVEMPIQACLFLKKEKFKQKVHNVVIVEEGAELYLITGCSASQSATEGLHVGTTEFFVKKGGYLNSTMVHSWHEDTTVRPVSIALVEESGSFISNYISLRPVKDITMYPTAVLLGEHARSSLNSLILSHPGSTHDIGSRVIFKAKNTQGEAISRVVSLGGKTISRGHMKAEVEQVRAHLECRGLILSKEGYIYAIPELETLWRDVDMSHEAAIGKINKDEIEYLASRGMSQQEAQSVIIRGFMDANILGLPELLKKEIDSLEDNMLSGGF